MTMKRNRALTIACYAAIALLMLALNLLTPLLADDYRYAFSFATGERLKNVVDIFPSLAAHAVSINGRLVPHFFVQLFTLLPRQVFSVVNTVVFLLLIAGMYRLSQKEEQNWKLLVLIFGGMFLLPPVFGQSFLWLAGSVNYLWCDTLLVWLLVPFADAVFGKRNTLSIAGQVCVAFGALLFGNMSENVSAAGGVMMGLCVAWLFWKHRRVPLWMLLSVVMTLAGWLVLMLVPATRGSVARSSGSVAALFSQFGTALEMWKAHGLWATLGVIVLLCFTAKRIEPARVAFSAGLLISSLLCNFAMTVANYYPERAFTGSCVLLVMAYAVVFVVLPREHAALLKAAALCMALLVLEGVNTVPNACNRYRQAEARVQEVCEARDSGGTDITTYGVLGRSRFDAFYHLNELTDDFSYFPNVYFSKYYGLGSVVVDHYE